MECAACSYKQPSYWDIQEASEEDKEKMEEMPEFIRIEIGPARIRKENEFGTSDVGLYVCPKCSTVRMEEL